MAVSFSQNWNNEIAAETEKDEYQTCTISILDPNEVWYPGPNYDTDPTDLTKKGYDPLTNTYLEPVIDGIVYEGRARFIPVRAAIYHGGESQANAMTVRAMRFQLPQFEGPLYIRMGLKVQFQAAPRNPSLVGRWASVTDDFQGSSAATRTFNASMDIDAGGPNG